MKIIKSILIALVLIMCVLTILCLCACVSRGGGVNLDECSHEWRKWKTKTSATCTADGLKTRECSLCGEVEEKVIFATGHSESGWITDAEVTCTEDGSKHKECTVCGVELKTEAIEAPWHSGGKATCTKKAVCDVCGEEYGEPLRHDITETIIAPTCTEAGEGKEVCSRCDYEKEVEIPALGHDIVNHEAQEATCTEIGWEAYDACSRCDYSTYAEIEAMGHVESDWIVDADANCIEAGSKHKRCTVCGKILATESIEKIAHNYTSTVVTAPTCSTQGYTTHTCSCGDSYVDTHVDALGHEYREWVNEVDATCTADGTNGYYECSVCKKYFDEGKNEIKNIIIKARGHNYAGCVCTKCGAEFHMTNGNYCCHDDVIYFGTYPQSEVTDTSVTDALTALSGELPTADDSKAWTSYGYYISGSVSNFMWHIDIENDNEKYRGVYFTSYRPYFTTYSSSTSNSYQDDNGYYTSTVYWFKYEPIKWQILMESDGKAFLLADIAIDSQNYYITSSNSTRTVNGSTVYETNYTYSYSTIREWLTDTFYNTAFNDLQKELILTTTVDNSVSSTGDSYNSYACANTSDRVFLLSYKEITYLTSTTARIRKSTDYAKSQGCWANTSSGYVGNCWWWLRSPIRNGSDAERDICDDGSVVSNFSVNRTSRGVVPALWIAL